MDTQNVSSIAIQIASLTGVNKYFIDDFVAKNSLDPEKIINYIINSNYKDRLDFISFASGYNNNPIQKRLIAQFSK